MSNGLGDIGRTLGKRFGPLVLAATLSNGPAFADANEGELFGYRIGDRYPIGNSTKLMHVQPDSWWAGKAYFVLAERAIVPPDLGPVYLVVTQRTFTIVRITSSKTFGSAHEQISYAYKYARVAIEKYGDSLYGWDPRQVPQIRIPAGRGGKEKFDVHVSIVPDSDDSPVTGMHAVHIGLWPLERRKLMDQAVRESQEARYLKPADKGSSKGF